VRRPSHFPRAHAVLLLALPEMQEYIDQHSLQKVVEDVLNGCVKTKPDEPLSFMVRANIRLIWAAWWAPSAMSDQLQQPR